MAKSNLRSSLAQRPSRDPMARYDRLPPDLRHWLAQAALPWGPRSSLRLWQRLLRQTGGNVAAATQRLTMAEQKTLRRDAAKIWGESYPS